jgi:KDO2-lipid IV(A) lauroyltransferase
MSGARKNKALKRFRHFILESWILYALVVGSAKFLSFLPVGVARFIGRLGGRIACFLDFGHREICMRNLALAFPEKTDAERRKILRASYVHLGLCVADFCQMLRLSPEKVCSEWIVPEDPKNSEKAKEMLSRGRGLICISGHIGLWELTGGAFPLLSGKPMVSVSRELAAPRIEKFVADVRQRFGAEIIHQEGAVQQLIRALRDGKSIGLLTDQWAGRESSWIKFFGQETSTAATAALLHLRARAPIACHFMLRRPDGRYTWRCNELKAPPAELSTDERIRLILEGCNKEFEEAIRAAPEQWLWMHKRWRPKPKERAAQVSSPPAQLSPASGGAIS